MREPDLYHLLQFSFLLYLAEISLTVIIDFSIIKGINPRNKNEVSLSVDLMKNNNLDLGDYIKIKVGDEEKEFLIVGSFASMMSGGQSMRLTSDVISDNSIGNVAFVNLKNIDDYAFCSGNNLEKLELR